MLAPDKLNEATAGVTELFAPRDSPTAALMVDLGKYLLRAGEEPLHTHAIAFSCAVGMVHLPIDHATLGLAIIAARTLNDLLRVAGLEQSGPSIRLVGLGSCLNKAEEGGAGQDGDAEDG